MWESYKKFCADRQRELDRAWRKWGYLRSSLGMCWTVFLWFMGSLIYFALGATLLACRLLWWLVKLLIFGVWWLFAKLFRRDAPAFSDLFDVAGKPEDMSGVEFEQYVAGKLRDKGYHDIKLTPASGDYGVDITAEKDGVRYAFQCKRYATPVGVKAVQEVFSGCRKYEADRAVVITNSSYTARAQALADDLGVTLWDLEMLDAIL